MTPWNDPRDVPSSAPDTPDVPAPPERLAEGVWAGDLRATPPATMSWLWHGYLAPANVILWTSRWKAGKTTLLSVLLSRRATGGQLAGLAVRPGRTALVSEESRQLWELRRQRLDFGNHTYFLFRPFPGKPSLAQWLALVEHLARLGESDGVDLAVIDSLSQFLPGRTENHAALIVEALTPLRQLTERGMAVLLLHHPKKGVPAEGQAARGSGALSSFVDVLVEMDCCRRARAGDDRRRTLRGFSRYDETPGELVIELNAEGTDYAARGDAAQDEFGENWARLRAVLAEAPGKLGRRQIAAAWPDADQPPAATSLRRWLTEAVTRGLLRREGAGTRESPLRYWLPEAEERWNADPLYRMREADRLAQERLARLGPGGAP